MLVGPLTVAENIVLGAEPGSPALLDLAKRRPTSAACPMSSSSAVDPHAIVDTLSVGQQQRVELLKALYRTRRC